MTQPGNPGPSSLGPPPTPSRGSGRVGAGGGPLKLQRPLLGVCMLSEGLHREGAQLGLPQIPPLNGVHGCVSRVHIGCYAWAGAGRWSQRPCFLGVTCSWAVASPNLDLMNCGLTGVQQGSACVDGGPGSSRAVPMWTEDWDLSLTGAPMGCHGDEKTVAGHGQDAGQARLALAAPIQDGW